MFIVPERGMRVRFTCPALIRPQQVAANTDRDQ